MGRLIDKDALLGLFHIKKPCMECQWVIKNCYDLEFSLMDICQWIEEEPEVDAVPVVRCKDCKYGQPDANKYGQLWCDWFYAYNPVNGGKEGYCSQAKKRREGETECD